MPRVTRNFWVNGDIDGAATPVSTGPRKTDGGLDFQFLIRDNGEVSESVRVVGEVHPDGVLKLTVLAPNGDELFVQRTKR